MCVLILPVGEWENSCNELQRMLIVRSMRSDRVPFCVTTFIVNNLGSKSDFSLSLCLSVCLSVSLLVSQSPISLSLSLY